MSEKAFYPITDLRLFPRHNRETFLSEFNVQAPPWDKARRIKRWIDPEGMDGGDPRKMLTYSYWDAAARQFKQFGVTAGRAVTVNLPGAYAYAKYEIPPTQATMYNQPLNAKILCYEVSAKALAQELGGVAVKSDSFSMGQYQIDWRGETRRIWHIALGAELFNAGSLLEKRHRDGVDAPGRWEFAANSQPVWTSVRDDTGEQDARPEIPMPSRVLNENEALHHTPMASIVYRTDLPSEFNDATGGTGIPADIADAVRRTDVNVQEMLAVLRSMFPRTPEGG